MPEQVKELYYVKDGALYHKGPGRVYVREIDKANLYPQPVARKIAQLKSQLLKILEEHMAAACQEARQG